jgi:hypothetical protein
MLCSWVCQRYRGTRITQHGWYLRTRSRRAVYLGLLYLRIRSRGEVTGGGPFLVCNA